MGSCRRRIEPFSGEGENPERTFTFIGNSRQSAPGPPEQKVGCVSLPIPKPRVEDPRVDSNPAHRSNCQIDRTIRCVLADSRPVEMKRNIINQSPGSWASSTRVTRLVGSPDGKPSTGPSGSPPTRDHPGLWDSLRKTKRVTVIQRYQILLVLSNFCWAVV